MRQTVRGTWRHLSHRPSRGLLFSRRALSSEQEELERYERIGPMQMLSQEYRAELIEAFGDPTEAMDQIMEKDQIGAEEMTHCIQLLFAEGDQDKIITFYETFLRPLIAAEEYDPDDFMYKVVMYGYNAAERWDRVILIFNEMQHRGIPVDLLAVGFAQKAAYQLNDLQTAIRLLNVIDSTDPHLVAQNYHMVLAMCEKVSDWRNAIRVLEKMPQPDGKAYTSVLKTLEMTMEFNQASEILTQARSVLPKQDREASLYTPLFSICVNAQASADHVFRLMDWIEEDGIDVPGEFYQSALGLCLVNLKSDPSLADKAIEFASTIQEKGITVHAFVYSSLVMMLATQELWSHVLRAESLIPEEHLSNELKTVFAKARRHIHKS